MAHPLKFTEEFRQAELARGEQSLFYFERCILGFDRLNEWDFELCAALEGRPPYEPWLRFLLTKYRGGFKSTVATQGYPLWRGIYIPNFSTKLIEGSSENAKNNHHMPLVDLFVSSPRAEYLQWLFSHRIPDNFVGWNSERLTFVKTNPLASDTLSFWGINSKYEGWHGDLVVIDDAQGTEVEGSDIGVVDAWRAYDRATPLLTDQTTGQILVIGVGPIRGARSFVHEMKRDYDRVIDASEEAA